ncbi:hypothetical protein BC834DRAFT_94960 [Gloeopeniophorella convolvens]|nr:hypothetical protein BC834DRAFT_94960 [Gloeopeniophorella convolvens]
MVYHPHLMILSLLWAILKVDAHTKQAIDINGDALCPSLPSCHLGASGLNDAVCFQLLITSLSLVKKFLFESTAARTLEYRTPPIYNTAVSVLFIRTRCPPGPTLKQHRSGVLFHRTPRAPGGAHMQSKLGHPGFN